NLLARNNNQLVATDIDQCVGVLNPLVPNPTQIQVDIVLNNSPETIFGDVRLNLRDNATGLLLPQTTASVSDMTATPFLDGINPVGFINLPVLRQGTLTTATGNTRRAVS